MPLEQNGNELQQEDVGGEGWSEFLSRWAQAEGYLTGIASRDFWEYRLLPAIAARALSRR